MATTETNGELKDFVNWYHAGRVKPPNLTQLAKYGIRSDTGCKGGRPPKNQVSQLKHTLTGKNQVSLQYGNYNTGNVQTVNNKTGFTPVATT